jgi:diacylglycerol kinase family enzyme
MPNAHAKVIVNPAAGARTTYRHWPEIQHLLHHGGLNFDYQYTEGSGHATVLAREAASDGYRFLVAVGGAGTINEVANGLLTAPPAETTTMGIVSTGTGNDFIRSLGVPRDYASACQRLSLSYHNEDTASPVVYRTRIDVGLVEYTSGGERRQRYFVNGAGWALTPR